MKKENDNEKKKGGWKEAAKDKKFYLYTVIGCAIALLSLVIVAVAVSLGEKQTTLENESGTVITPDDSGNEKPDGDTNEPTGGNVEDMILPMQGVAVSNEYEFYYNQTLNAYYQHVGLDFASEAGAEVLAAQSGVIEGIYRDELLTGTEITIDHGEGVKSVYRYVDALEGLKVGDTVSQGQRIATVAEAVGDEYKDGAHLHFEVLKNGKNVDPATYLTFEEK